MSSNLVEIAKSIKTGGLKHVSSSQVISDNPLLFQIFFLAQDENQDVKILKTNEIDLNKILFRIKMGQTTLIKYKNQEVFDFCYRINNKVQKHQYFIEC